MISLPILASLLIHCRFIDAHLAHWPNHTYSIFSPSHVSRVLKNLWILCVCGFALPFAHSNFFAHFLNDIFIQCFVFITQSTWCRRTFVFLMCRFAFAFRHSKLLTHFLQHILIRCFHLITHSTYHMQINIFSSTFIAISHDHYNVYSFCESTQAKKITSMWFCYVISVMFAPLLCSSRPLWGEGNGVHEFG